MILLDTNILIEILKGNEDIIIRIEDLAEILAISMVSEMELYYGARDKLELKKLKRFCALFHSVPVTENISITAKRLVLSYAKSHSLMIPDALIAATALEMKAPLMTLNIKDFRYIAGLKLFG